ncbi:MAG: N-formylglutamate amidohydrolase [Pirellulaceae bacterium]|nr:N-formylglutamate amidohydrolase [Pirellulaceae bacterium]
MKLPFVLSVPHAGLIAPPEVEPFCRLTPDEISADGDEGASEIYSLRDHVECFVTTDIARAIVDLNRAEDDRRRDGVVKTHTCWDVPVYHDFPPETVIEQLLANYYRPYHRALSDAASHANVRLGIDGHTMAALGPPVGPDTGAERPPICLGNVDGQSLPEGWTATLAECLADAFNFEISVNEPFRGGYITRRHMIEMPWIQIEFSRASFLPDAEKRTRLLDALDAFCRRVF